MEKQNNITKTFFTNVEVSMARPFFEGYARKHVEAPSTGNTHKTNTTVSGKIKFAQRGITLIALVITIIILLILAGVVLNLTLGEHGILKKAEQGAEQYKISEILEKLELEKVDLILRKNGETPSIQEYIDHLINKGIITLADVTDIDDNNKNIVVEGYVFLVEKEANGDIKITYQGKDTKAPRIAKIQVTETTIDSITVKVIASNTNGGSYKYSIKNITAGETSFTEVNTLNTNEYTFTGLTINNDYIIQVELVTSEGTDIKETSTIKTELPKVTSITLDKTNIELLVGDTDIITATILPENAGDKTITWTSSNDVVVTIDDGGNVTAVGEGVAIITVTSNEVNTVTATCNITVATPPPPSAGAGGEVHKAKQIPYTWEELNSLAKVISDNYGTGEGQVNNSTAEVNVSINGKSGTLGIGDWTTVNGKQVRILGFNHDELVDQTIYGETNTYAGISFEYVNFLETNQMNNSDTYVNGWGACQLRTRLNYTIYNGLENKEFIKKVSKSYFPNGKKSASLSKSEDYLWNLSCSELYNRGTSMNGNIYPIGCASGIEGARYKYYVVSNPSPDYNTGVLDVQGGCLRSSDGHFPDWYTCVHWPSCGLCASRHANKVIGVAPGFCI